MTEKLLFVIWEFQQALKSYMPAYSPWKTIVCFLIVFIVIFLIDGASKQEWKYCVIWAVYVTFVISITLLGRNVDIDKHFSFSKILIAIENLKNDFFHAKYELIFNVILFIPYGVLMRYRIHQIKHVMLIGCITVLCVEIMQEILKVGQLEVLDLIENNAGIWLGIFLYRVLKGFITNSGDANDGKKSN